MASDVILSVDADTKQALDTLESLKDRARHIFDDATNSNINDPKFDATLGSLDKATLRADKLRRKIEELGNTKFNTASYQALSLQFDKLEAKADKLRQSIADYHAANKGWTAECQQQEEELKKLEVRIDGVANGMQKLEAKGLDHYMGTETQQYQDYGEALNSLNNDIVKYAAKASAMLDANEELSDSVNQCTSAHNSFSRVVRNSTSAAASFGKFLSNLGSIGVKGIQKIISAFSKLNRTILNGISAVGRFVSHFKSLGKASDDSSAKLQKMFKTFIKYTFGVRSFFFLFRKMRKAVSEGFENLAQVHEPFNEAMSSIITSLNYLKNTFAAAFAPIIETVAPMLTTFINLIAEAVSKVGQFIAALTGKEYVRAGSVQIDYADSVDKSSKSTESATKATEKRAKAQKELNREITHFDDLVILHDKHDDDDDDTSASVGDVPQYAFSTVPIGEAVSTFAKNFKAAWDKADFTDIGRKIGEKLKGALEGIPWDEIKKTTSKIAKSLATFLNGYLETPGLYYTIGKTIAEGINTAVLFVHDFIYTFHWSSLGDAFREKILGLLENINWELIYETAKGLGSGIGDAVNSGIGNVEIWSSIFTTLANGFNTIIIALHSFLWTVKWKKLGASVGNGITVGLKKINWTKVYGTCDKFGSSLASFLNGLITPETFATIGDTVAKCINSALRVLNKFGHEFNWFNFGFSLATGLNHFLINFKSGTLTSGINAFVKGLRDAIIAFLDGVDWYKFGTTIRDIIKDIEWDTVLLSIGAVIWAAINKAIEFLRGLFNADNISTPFTDALTDLSKTVNTATEKIDFKSLSAGFDSLVDALAPAVQGFGVGFINVLEALVTAGIDFLNKLGPILSVIGGALAMIPPEVLKELGELFGQLAAALLVINGLTKVAGILTSIVKPLGDIATNAAKASEALGGAGAATGGGIGSAVGGALNNIGFTGALMQLIDHVSESGTALQEIPWYLRDVADSCNLTSDAALYTFSRLNDIGMTMGFDAELAGKMAQELTNAAEVNGDYGTSISNINDYLTANNISVEDFRARIQEMADNSPLWGARIGYLSGYLIDVGTSAETSDEKTTTFTEVFGKFGGLGVAFPAKIKVLSNAIDTIASSSQLSDEQLGNLHTKLLNYKVTDGGVTSWNNLTKAIEDTGISADEFSAILKKSMDEVDPTITTAFDAAEKSITKAGPTVNKAAENIGEDTGEGYTNGIESEINNITNAAEKMTTEALDTIKKTQDSNSPSRKTREFGNYFGEGFIEGIKDKQREIIKTVTELMSKTLQETRSYIDEFEKIGTELITALNTSISNGANVVVETGTSMIQSVYDGMNRLDFWEIGKNIATGIYNGLVAHAGWLEVLAWNTAVDMYNAACSALSIASPSKKFAWIGEMITRGLGKGVSDNEDIAVDAVTNMTEAMTKEAQEANPAVQLSGTIDNWINGLDQVLTKFSDTIIDKFDSMMSTLIQLSNVPNIPAIAQGKVIPATLAVTNGYTNNSDLQRVLEGLSANQLTVDDLRPMLIEVINDYMNMAWYIGDEQLARHVNRGNSMLDRRYSLMKS